MEKHILIKTSVITIALMTVFISTFASVAFAWTYYDWVPAHDTDGTTHGVTSYAVGYYDVVGSYPEQLHESFRYTDFPWGFLSSMFCTFEGFYSGGGDAYDDSYTKSDLWYPKYYYYSDPDIKTVKTTTSCDFINWWNYEYDSRSATAITTASGQQI